MHLLHWTLFLFFVRLPSEQIAGAWASRLRCLGAPLRSWPRPFSSLSPGLGRVNAYVPRGGLQVGFDSTVATKRGDSSGLGVAREVVAEDLGLHAAVVRLSRSRKGGNIKGGGSQARAKRRRALGLDAAVPPGGGRRGSLRVISGTNN
jgi:hypothetical protein